MKMLTFNCQAHSGAVLKLQLKCITARLLYHKQTSDAAAVTFKFELCHLSNADQIGLISLVMLGSS